VVFIAKTLRFSKKVPPTGCPVLDTVATVITVVSLAKDVYDYFTDDKKR
jgi:hypothetical protein